MKDRVENTVRLTDRLALRPREAAAALGVSERTLRQILPQLPHVRVAGCVLLPVEGLRDWLREHAEAQRGRADAAVEDVLRSLGEQSE